MAELDLAGIRARAQAATPGPWRWWTSNSWWRLSSDARGHTRDGGVLCPVVNPSDRHPDLSISEEDAAHIAGMNPLTTLALVAEVERLTLELEREHGMREAAERSAGCFIKHGQKVEAERDELRVRVTELEAAKAA